VLSSNGSTAPLQPTFSFEVTDSNSVGTHVDTVACAWGPAVTTPAFGSCRPRLGPARSVPPACPLARPGRGCATRSSPSAAEGHIGLSLGLLGPRRPRRHDDRHTQGSLRSWDRGHRPQIRPLRRCSQLVALRREAQGAAFHCLLGKRANPGGRDLRSCEVPAFRDDALRRRARGPGPLRWRAHDQRGPAASRSGGALPPRTCQTGRGGGA
jgi:hypothetical protein